MAIPPSAMPRIRYRYTLEGKKFGLLNALLTANWDRSVDITDTPNFCLNQPSPLSYFHTRTQLLWMVY